MKYSSIKAVLVVLLVLPLSVFSQLKTDTISNSKPTKQKLNPGLGKEVFSAKHLLIFGGLLGSAFLLDEWTHDKIQSNQSHFLKHYTNFSKELGEKKIMGSATLATWLIGKAIKDDRLSNTAYNSAKALLVGAILTEGIKTASGRSRPYLNRGSIHFHAFGNEGDRAKSFPSGHSFVAWSLITPFAEEYSKWLYAVPISVSFARMYQNKHWLSDVVLGGGIGYFAGLYFQKRKNQRVIFSGNGIIIKF